MLKDQTFWLLLFTMLAHFSLGVLVITKNPRGTMNRLLFCFSISAALWSVAVLNIVVKDQYHSLLFWARAAHAIAITVPFYILAMSFAITERNLWQQTWIRLVALGCLVLAILSFTPLIVSDMAFPLENKDLVLGPLFPLYTLFYLGGLLFALGKLYRKLRRSRGLLRLQLRYFFWGTTLSLTLGSLSNMFLPLLGIKAVDLRPFGPTFSLIMVGAISYAIIKYRLMDIRLFVRNGLVIFITAFVFSITFGLVLYFMGRSYMFASTNFFVVTAAVLSVALFFTPLRTKVQKLVDRYFFRGAYDYHVSLLKSSRAMVSLLNLESLIEYIAKNLFEKMQLEHCSFFKRNESGDFSFAASYFASKDKAFPPDMVIRKENPLSGYLTENNDPLLIADILHIPTPELRETLTLTLQNLRSETAIPVVLDQNLEGIFLLGPKLSGEPFSQEDENLLAVLTSQITVAWRNGQLYQEVLTTKQHLENVLANMGNALIAINSAGMVTLFNSAAERFTGCKAEKILGKKGEEVLVNGLGDLYKQAFAEKHDIKEMEQVFRREGKELHLSCNITLVEEGPDRGKGAIMLLSDVTRIKELEKEKAQALRFASLGEVAAGMAHEIKNPLVSIKTFAELLPEKYNDDEFRHTFSRIVTQEIERINTLILQLLDLTADPMLFFQKTKIEDIMDEVLLLLSPYLETCRVRLAKAYDPNTPAVNVDRNHIKQALFNICLNSIQAMGDGGELSINLMPSPCKKDKGNLPDVIKGVKIMIKDTGTGIPEAIKHRIFDPFFTTKADGMGMGLSLSHKILSAHGGVIEFCSNGEGTLFEVYLPVLSE